KVGRVEAPQGRQQLALASRPFQQTHEFTNLPTHQLTNLPISLDRAIPLRHHQMASAVTTSTVAAPYAGSAGARRCASAAAPLSSSVSVSPLTPVNPLRATSTQIDAPIPSSTKAIATLK